LRCFVGICWGGATAQKIDKAEYEAYVSDLSVKWGFAGAWAEICNNAEVQQQLESHRGGIIAGMGLTGYESQPLLNYLDSQIEAERSRLGNLTCDRQSLRDWSDRLVRSEERFLKFLSKYSRY